MTFAFEVDSDRNLPFLNRDAIGQMESVEAPDDYTFVIYWRGPYYQADSIGLRALWPQVCALYGHVADRVGDVHGAGAATADGFASTMAFLRRRLRMDTALAARLIRVGADMGYLAAVRVALGEGEISVEHADAIRYVAADLGEQVMAGGELEKILLDYAKVKTPGEVRRLGRLIKAHMATDEDADERQVRLHEGRWLTATTTFEGMVRLEGILDPVVGAAVLAALEAYMPGPDPPHDIISTREGPAP